MDVSKKRDKKDSDFQKNNAKEQYNPFYDLSFWLHLATIDFGFLSSSEKNDEEQKHCPEDKK